MPVPLVAAGAALNVIKGIPLIGGIFKGSSAGPECADADSLRQAILGGAQRSLDRLVSRAGLGDMVQIAATDKGKHCYMQALANLLQSGAITGPTGTGEYGLPSGGYLVGQYQIASYRGTAASPGGEPTLSALGVTGGKLPGWVLLVVGVLILLALPRLVKGS